MAINYCLHRLSLGHMQLPSGRRLNIPQEEWSLLRYLNEFQCYLGYWHSSYSFMFHYSKNLRARSLAS